MYSQRVIQYKRQSKYRKVFVPGISNNLFVFSEQAQADLVIEVSQQE